MQSGTLRGTNSVNQSTTQESAEVLAEAGEIIGDLDAMLDSSRSSAKDMNDLQKVLIPRRRSYIPPSKTVGQVQLDVINSVISEIDVSLSMRLPPYPDKEIMDILLPNKGRV